MAAKKRRRTSAKTAAVTPAAVATPATPSKAPRSTAPPRRIAASATDIRDVPWNTAGLLALLGIAFLIQIPIGAIIHYTSHANPLVIDLFFFQPQYLVLACVVVMPLARRLTGQPRNLRLLESLSLGVMYALISLMVGTVFVHPSNAAVATDQFIKSLTLGDGLLLALADVIALAGTVALYPSFTRLLGAPGRRARARMLQRAGSKPAPDRGAASRDSKRAARPRR